MGQLSQQKMQQVINQSKSLNFPVMIETGTYTGYVWRTFHGLFEKIITVDINKKYYEENRVAAPSHVEFRHGDTRDQLPSMISSVGADKNVLFWLDAHYSPYFGNTKKGDDCPLYDELTIIDNTFKGKEAILMIDDVQCFGGKTEEFDWLNINVEEMKKRIVNHKITYTQIDGEIFRMIIEKK